MVGSGKWWLRGILSSGAETDINAVRHGPSGPAISPALLRVVHAGSQALGEWAQNSRVGRSRSEDLVPFNGFSRHSFSVYKP